MIDNLYRVETPEGIDLQAQLAGPVPRALAFLFDLIIRAAVYIAGAIVFGLFDGGIGFLLILLFILEWLYPVFFEVLLKGQTPGKQSLNITVVNDDLTPISWNASIIRNLLRTVDILPFFYFFGFLTMLFSSHHQRLGDLAAGTLVIHVNDKPKDTTLPNCEPQAPTSPLQQDDQIALISYTLRHQQLTESRSKELANILTPMHGRSDLKAVTYIQSLGRWLLGDRG